MPPIAAFKKVAGLVLCCLILFLDAHQSPARPNYNLDSLAFIPIFETEGCWGYVDTANNKEYALICAVDRLEIWEVTDPSNPLPTATVPATGFDLKQVRPYGNHLFAVNQFGTGLQIIDVSNISNAFTAATYSTQSSNGGAHTVHIDGNYAYLAVNGTVPASWRILDISNPLAPVEVGSYLTSVSSGFVQSHDSYIKGDTAYIAFLSGGFSAVDISNKSAPVRLADVYYPNAFTHNCWTTEDGKYLFTTDETPQGPSVPSGYLHVWDVQKPESVRLVAEWKSPSPGAIIHNVQVRGNYLYVSHYTDGVVILDIEDPTQPVEVAHYDTTPDDSSGGFAGCWDFFPYFPSGNLVASNLFSSEGMWLLHFDSAKAGYLQGRVTNWATGDSLPDVTIRSVDYWRQVKNDSAGNYFIRTEGGNVRVEFSKEGFRPETVTVAAALNDTTDVPTVQLVSLSEFPAAPTSLSAWPDSLGNIYLSWQAPPDADLMRFRIYRTSLVDTATFFLLDSVDYAVTNYTDPGVNAGERFGYRVTAVDSVGLESPLSPPVRTMRFVFGNKVLLIDRTRYSFKISPAVARDSLSRFHRRLLRRFDYDSLDLNDISFPLNAFSINPASFSQYPVIVVHSSEFTNSYFRDNPSFLTFFNDFLKAGGKLVLAGHFPFSGGPQNTEICYHDPFLTGHTTRDAWEEGRNLLGFDCLFFPRFYFTDSSLATHSFLFAEPEEPSYPRLEADSARVDLFVRTFPADRHYQYPTVPNIGYLTNRNPAEDLYSFGSILGGVDDKHGRTVAKKHLGGGVGGSFVWFNFPLFFMKEDSAKKAFLMAMADLGVAEDFPKGDIDRDGIKNLQDVAYFINYIFSGTPFVEFDSSEMNMNCDGEVGPTDIVLFLLDIYDVQPLPCN